MSRVGRPKSINAPPCPTCSSVGPVVAHGFRESGGSRRRSFRCTACDLRFTPGAAPRGADPALRAAVRRVHEETDVSYRLLARALTRHLGVSTSHVTVGAWCRETERAADPDRTPCEYLSLLWALRQELTEAEQDTA